MDILKLVYVLVILSAKSEDLITDWFVREGGQPNWEE